MYVAIDFMSTRFCAECRAYGGELANKWSKTGIVPPPSLSSLYLVVMMVVGFMMSRMQLSFSVNLHVIYIHI